MVKEYIERLMLEEQEEIEKLQLQMKKSLNELQSSQQWLENLQREKHVEINIFSPRKFDFEADEKIEKARAAVREHDQNVEYIRNLIESHTKRSQEYKKLQEENELEISNAAQSAGGNATQNIDINAEKCMKDITQSGFMNETAGQNEAAVQNKNTAQTDVIQKGSTVQNRNILDDAVKYENAEQNKSSDTLLIDTVDPDILRSYIDKKEVVDFIKTLYKKAEISLALLNGDKNKCKNELKSIMRTMKKYVLELEKNEK